MRPLKQNEPERKAKGKKESRKIKEEEKKKKHVIREKQEMPDCGNLQDDPSCFYEPGHASLIHFFPSSLTSLTGGRTDDSCVWSQ